MTLLNDKEIAKFIVDGFHIITPEKLTGKTSSFHEKVYDKIVDHVRRYGSPGNNVSPVIPEMKEIITDQAVVGCLTSLLGPDYNLHAHRHAHLAKKDQKWHRDSYWGNMKEFGLEPRWVMLMYYPQTVTKKNGPTEVVAGSHYITIDRSVPNFHQMTAKDIPGRYHQVRVEAGSIVIIDYHLWHRGTMPLIPSTRYMLKYQFYRTKEPACPTSVVPQWDEDLYKGSLSYNESMDDVYRCIWYWLHGAPDKAKRKMLLWTWIKDVGPTTPETEIMSQAFSTNWNNQILEFLRIEGKKGRAARYILQRAAYTDSLDHEHIKQILNVVKNMRLRSVAPLIKVLQLCVRRYAKEITTFLFEFLDSLLEVSARSRARAQLVQNKRDQPLKKFGSIQQISSFREAYVLISVCETLSSCSFEPTLRSQICKSLYNVIKHLTTLRDASEMENFACQFAIMQMVSVVEYLTDTESKVIIKLLEDVVSSTKDRYILAYSCQVLAMIKEREINVVYDAKTVLLDRMCPFSTAKSPF
jgi:hypothetical protein